MAYTALGLRDDARRGTVFDALVTVLNEAARARPRTWPPPWRSALVVLGDPRAPGAC